MPMMGRDQAFALHMMRQVYEQAIVVLAEGDVDAGHYAPELHVLLHRITRSTVPWATDAQPLEERYKEDDEPDPHASVDLSLSLFEQLDHYVRWGLEEHMVCLRTDAVPVRESSAWALARALLDYHDAFSILNGSPANSLASELDHPHWDEDVLTVEASP